MQCDAIWLLKSVIADANTILMPTLQLCSWAKNAGVGINQWAAETMRIWQDECVMTTQRIDNKVRERIWEIARSMSIVNNQGAGPDQWDLLMDCCVTRIS
jgi:hypothetical protein